MFPSHRNQSIDLPSKSIEWILYAESDRNTSYLWVKDKQNNINSSENNRATI